MIFKTNTVNDIVHWMNYAVKGDKFTYHVGGHTNDTHESFQKSKTMFNLYKEGYVELLQKKLSTTREGLGVYSFLAIRTAKPRKNINVK